MPTLEDLQKDLKDSDAAIRSKMAEMKTELDNQRTALDAMKAAGERPETPPAIAKRMDELDKSIGDGNTRMKELQEEITAKLLEASNLGIEAQKRLDLLEKAGGGGAFDPDAYKTAGDLLIEKLTGEGFDEMRAGFASGDRKAKDLPRLGVKSFAGTPTFDGFLPGTDLRKALTSTPSTAVNPTSNFVPVMQIPGYIPMQRRRLRMRDLIPMVPTQSPSIRYLRQTGFAPTATGATVTITSSAGIATVAHTGHGYQDFDLIKIAGANQSAYNGNKRITVVDEDSYTYPVSGGPASPATGTITAKRQNNWGAAAFVSEGSTKPQADMTFEERICTVEVLAHYIKATRQVFDDLPGLRNSVDNDLLYGLLFREDYALLYGTGVSPQIAGIMLDPDVQTTDWSAGAVLDTKADAIRRSRTLVELALYEATGAVIHPKVWEEIELEKGSDGHYLWVQGPAGLNPAGESIWRIPLVVTPAIRADQWLIGAFGAAATLYDREQANIRFSESNEDDFINNRVAILAEERLGAAWKRPEAFVVGSFDSAPTDGV